MHLRDHYIYSINIVYIYIYIDSFLLLPARILFFDKLTDTTDRRKFRSQTSDNMDR